MCSLIAKTEITIFSNLYLEATLINVNYALFLFSWKITHFGSAFSNNTAITYSNDLNLLYIVFLGTICLKFSSLLDHIFSSTMRVVFLICLWRNTIHYRFRSTKLLGWAFLSKSTLKYNCIIAYNVWYIKNITFYIFNYGENIKLYTEVIGWNTRLLKYQSTQIITWVGHRRPCRRVIRNAAVVQIRIIFSCQK